MAMGNEDAEVDDEEEEFSAVLVSSTHVKLAVAEHGVSVEYPGGQGGGQGGHSVEPSRRAKWSSGQEKQAD